MNLCLYWIVESDPRLVFGSFHYECLLGYPLLTPSTVAHKPLFEHLCSSRGFTNGRISMGVARATPAGVAPRPWRSHRLLRGLLLLFRVWVFSTSLLVEVR